MTVTWKAVFMHGAVDHATLLQINFQTSFSAVSNLRADPYKKNLRADVRRLFARATHIRSVLLLVLFSPAAAIYIRKARLSRHYSCNQVERLNKNKKNTCRYMTKRSLVTK
jgi:hypothetical protein